MAYIIRYEHRVAKRLKRHAKFIISASGGNVKYNVSISRATEKINAFFDKIEKTLSNETYGGRVVPYDIKGLNRDTHKYVLYTDPFSKTKWGVIYKEIENVRIIKMLELASFFSANFKMIESLRESYRIDRHIGDWDVLRGALVPRTIPQLKSKGELKDIIMYSQVNGRTICVFQRVDTGKYVFVKWLSSANGDLIMQQIQPNEVPDEILNDAMDVVEKLQKGLNPFSHVNESVYEVISTNKDITTKNGIRLHSLITLSDGAGRYDIVEDDGCYAIFQNKTFDRETGHTYHICPELHKALKSLPDLPLH